MNKIRTEDVLDEDFVDARELASDGYDIYRSVNLVSTTLATKTVVIISSSPADDLVFSDFPLQVGDFVDIFNNAAAGRYTVNTVVDSTSFTVVESIVDSIDGYANLIYPAGASKVGFDSTGVSFTNSDNLQDALVDIDAYLGTLINKRTVLVEFTLTDDVYNWSPFFFTWRGTGSDSNTGKRSGASGGIGTTQNCSPFQVPFDATITKAVLTVRGVGVQNGSVTYPVSYETDLFDVGFTSISKLADVDFSISNSFIVGTYTVGATNFKGSTTLNIDVDEGDLLGLRFMNGTGSSVAGQSRMAFVTFVMEER